MAVVVEDQQQGVVDVGGGQAFGEVEGLGHGEEGVGPSVLDGDGGFPGGEGDADGRVVGLEFGESSGVGGGDRFSGADGVVPVGEIGARILARRGQEVRGGDAVEEGVPALLLDAGRDGVGRCRCGAGGEEAAVRGQGGHEVVPRPHGVGGRHRHGDVVDGARPRREATVGQPDPVLERRQFEGLAGAVGDTGDTDLGLHQSFVDQFTGEILGVSDLVSLISQVDPSLGTGRGAGP